MTKVNIDVKLSQITIDKQQIIANGEDKALITVQLKDVKGSDVAIGGAKVVIICEGKGVLTDIIDNKNGSYSTTITSKVVGTEIIGFSVDDVKSNNTVTLNFSEITGSSDLTKLQKNDKDKDQPIKKTVVKFKIPYGRYSPLDIAGFDPAQAKELVEQRKVADYFKS